MLSSAFTFVKECFDELSDVDDFGYIFMDHKARTTREI